MRSSQRKPLALRAGFALGLLALLLGLVVWLRLPTFGRETFPQGPRADASALRNHVERLCELPRDATTPDGGNQATDYIRSVLSRTHAAISEQIYDTRFGKRTNIVARFGASEGPVTIVGAHYDAYEGLPGADDNASGVAALLELARLVDLRNPTQPIELVAYSTEEPPFFAGPEMGSAMHARSLRDAGRSVQGMVCLEMIGYYSQRQPFSSPLLYALYPSQGDFVAIVGRFQDRKLIRLFKRSFRGATKVPAVSYSGPTSFGSDLSDHRNYWQAGYPAIMITDTAFWRNPNYHTHLDLPNTLDYRKMAGVVDGVLSSIFRLSGTGSGER